MSWNITPPVWRFITPTHPATTAAADVFSTMRQQIEGSSQYWQVVQTPNTGSNSLLLRCVNPQSITFYSGSSLTPLTGSEIYVLLANNVTGSSAYRAPETNASAAARIQVGIALCTGTFLGPQRDLPFDQPSGSIWSGYWHSSVLTNLSQSFFIEAPDIITVATRDAATNYATVFGALLETPRNHCLCRMYGMATSGPSGITTSFWTNSTLFLAHSVNISAAHTGIFTTAAGSIKMISTNNGFRAHWDNVSRQTYLVAAANFLAGTTRIFEPVGMYHVSASNQFVGFLRGMYVTGDLRSLEAVWDENNVEVARCLGNNRATAQDVVAFLPTSGSTVSYGPYYYAG